MLSQRKSHAVKSSKRPRKLDFSYTLVSLQPLNPRAQPHKLKAVSTGIYDIRLWIIHKKYLSRTFFFFSLITWHCYNRHCLQSDPSGYIHVLNYQLRLQGLVISMSCSDSLSISSKSRQTIFAFGEMLADLLDNREAATSGTRRRYRNQTCTAATGFSTSGCSSANRGSNSLILSTSSSDCSLPNGSKSGVWKQRRYIMVG